MTCMLLGRGVIGVFLRKCLGREVSTQKKGIFGSFQKDYWRDKGERGRGWPEMDEATDNTHVIKAEHIFFVH